MPIRLPNQTNRLVEIGRTGTGKTVAGLWHLSNFDLYDPWVILNFKDDEHIESIEKARVIDYSYVPKSKDHGLFVINVLPADLRGTLREASPLDRYLVRLWERQRIGVFSDETFMLANSDAYNMLLTQGRSRLTPIIACTQRPVWVSRFTFSEASFIQVFDMNDDRDIQTIESFVPLNWDAVQPLKKHQSFYYDVSENELYRLNPVPDMDEIRNRFDMKLRRQVQLI